MVEMASGGLPPPVKRATNGSEMRSVLKNIEFNPLIWIRNLLRMRGWAGGALDYVASTERTVARSRHIAVVVMAWSESDVPWFSIAMGLLLAARGDDVTFIVDDLPFGDRSARQRIVLACLAPVMKQISRKYRVAYLSREAAAETGLPTETVKEMARLNALRALRGELMQERRDELAALFFQQLSVTNKYVQGYLNKTAFELVVVPGGIHCSSGIWRMAARGGDVRVATFDGGNNGTALWAMNGVACHFADVPRVYAKAIERSDPVETERILRGASEEITARRAGTDRFGAQIQGTKDRGVSCEDYFLIALNVPWDTAALGLNGVFSGFPAFITETVRYVTTVLGRHIVIRQHPAERNRMTRSNDDYGEMLRKAFGENPLIHFIPAEATVNSYSLIEGATAVVVHTSTMGTEAAVMGKPVITPSRPYFADMGYVWAGEDLKEYHGLLSAAAGNALVVDEERQDLALISYYFSQRMNWVQSVFNTGDFSKWSKISFAEMFEDDVIQGLLHSVEDDVPICLHNHLRSVAASHA